MSITISAFTGTPSDWPDEDTSAGRRADPLRFSPTFPSETFRRDATFESETVSGGDWAGWRYSYADRDVSGFFAYVSLNGSPPAFGGPTQNDRVVRIEILTTDGWLRIDFTGDDRPTYTEVLSSRAFTWGSLLRDADTVIGATGEDGREVAFAYDGSPGPDRFDGGGGDDTLTGQGGNDRLDGLGGDDFIRGGGGRDTLRGGEDNDVIQGGSGADSIVGGRGDDRIGGGTGPDTIRGQAGDDTITGGIGKDVLFGGGGEDLIRGGGGDDRLFGRTGDDRLVGGNGADRLAGNQGDDTLVGGTGSDTVLGGQGRDEVFAGGGRDFIRGGAGGDALEGNGGADRIFGGAGNDVIVGGRGNDRLTGGSGSDTFFFRPGHGSNTITDFDPDEDVIAFRGSTPRIDDVRDTDRGVLIEARNLDILLLGVSRADIPDFD
jgi:Ca2+-binding RTX toxin-like protein